MSDRDLQLLAVLVRARCLSTEQLQRLFFPTQHETVLRRRLRRLAAPVAPLVKSLSWLDAWARRRVVLPTALGVHRAAALLPATTKLPSEDVHPDFFSHQVHLNELYVGLLEAPLKAALAKSPHHPGARRPAPWARAAHPAFTWTVYGDLELPWKAPRLGKAGPEARVIRPDALLELPQARRRLFVEAEMGTHSIVADASLKPGSTVAKLERYAAYCTLVAGPGKPSFYKERYPDALQPEVLFLVLSEARRRSVQLVIDGWRAKHPGAPVGFKALTVEGALGELLPLLGHAAPGVADAPAKSAASAPGGIVLSGEEFRLVVRYFAAAQGDFKARRDRARASGAPPPEYPRGDKELFALLQRLRPRPA